MGPNPKGMKGLYMALAQYLVDKRLKKKTSLDLKMDIILYSIGIQFQ